MQVALRSIIERFQRWRDRLRRQVSRQIFDRPLDQVGRFSETVLFVRWDAKLGDTVVLSWVIREIKRHRPDLQLAVLTGPGYLSLYRDVYQVDQVDAVPRRGAWLRLARIAWSLRRPRYVIHLVEHLKARDMFFLRCLRPAQLVGLDDDCSLVNVKLRKVTEGRHFSEILCDWLPSIGVPTNDRQYWVPDTPVDYLPAFALIKSDRFLIGFCPYGASRHRRFSDVKLLEVVRQLLRAGRTRVVLFATDAQKGALLRLLHQNHLRNDVILEPTSDLLGLFGQVRACDAIVSVDTGIVHVAAGLKKPLLAIYNPDPLDHDNHARWHPNSDEAITLFATRNKPQRIDDIDAKQLNDGIERLMSLIAAPAR